MYYQKILAIDGGTRGQNFSKSLLMANQFLAGAKSLGVDVEYIRLASKKIHHCVGCYQCWTKNPGVCIFQDDMVVILEKLQAADLAVFITPLYIFSVSALMKNFLDRLTPVLSHIMVENDNLSQHLLRNPVVGKWDFVVFAAAGFYEVEDNFEGIAVIFQNMHKRFVDMNLIGEFYLPAAEMLGHKLCRKRKLAVEKNCFAAGVQATSEGKIDPKYFAAVQQIKISRTAFVQHSNMVWKKMVRNQENFCSPTNAL